MLQDLRQGIRILLKSPGFTLVAALTLALGIGANTAIFSVANTVLLKPLPYRDPDSLVMVWETNVGRTRPNVANPGNYLNWKAQNNVFAEMSAVFEAAVTLTGVGEPERLPVQIVSSSFFPMLGITPVVGRTFSREEELPGAARVAVLSHQLWVRRFGSDAAVVGRVINLSNEIVPVIGVLPPGFRFLGQQKDLWLAYRVDPALESSRFSGRFLTVVARLKQGVSFRQAQAEMETIGRRLEQPTPRTRVEVSS